jgi:catechol 2,3-dioxygenase-like lactoylglutathione lyase family enzyme
MKTYYTGRLIDHLHLVTHDFAASRRFYAAVFAVLGRGIRDDNDHMFSSDEFNVSTPDNATVGNTHIHVAFQADSRAMVDRFHAAGVATGGHDNGAPGERGYHAGYYGAFLLDPDGNNIEAVFHAPQQRSADAVTIGFDRP